MGERSLISYLMLTLLCEMNAERRQKMNGSQPNWDARDKKTCSVGPEVEACSWMVEAKLVVGVVETGRKQ
jgi:hypothetical protein